MKKFIILGCAGYIAKKHFEAIYHNNGVIFAASDLSSNVGFLDKYSKGIIFLNARDNVDDFICRNKKKIDYLVICLPNFLHFKYIELAIKNKIKIICEKPLVSNLNQLNQLLKYKNIDKYLNCIMQLRYSPFIKLIKRNINECENLKINYITPRGYWYNKTWKSNFKQSGGLLLNIGIHLFDFMINILGKDYKILKVNLFKNKAKGVIIFKKTRVEWFLSLDEKDLPKNTNKVSYREVVINKNKFEFSEKFENLHTHSYREILNKRGLKLSDISTSLNLVYNIQKRVSDLKK